MFTFYLLSSNLLFINYLPISSLPTYLLSIKWAYLYGPTYLPIIISIN